MTTQQLERAIAQKKQFITDTAAQAEEIERRAEALPPGQRGSLNETARLLREKTQGLLIELHALEERLPPPAEIRVVTLEFLINRSSGFAHEQTPSVPEEMGHHWDGFTKAINQAAA